MSYLKSNFPSAQQKETFWKEGRESERGRQPREGSGGGHKNDCADDENDDATQSLSISLNKGVGVGVCLSVRQQIHGPIVSRRPSIHPRLNCCVSVSTNPNIYIQRWAIWWALGCVKPASWLPLAAGREFTQPRACLIAQLCMFDID